MAINNSVNLDNSADKWSSNLLVKDETGQLHKYNNQAPKAAGTAKQNNLALMVMAPALIPAEDKFLAVNPYGASHAKAKFGFHPEDEQELESIIKELPQDLSRKYSIEKIVDKLIEQEKLKFTAATKSKFTDILFDFFRNRRNAIIVRELLSEKIESNGKILSEEQVNNVVSIIKSIKSKIDSAAGLVVKISELAKQQSALPKNPVNGEVISSTSKPEIAILEAELNKEVAESKDKKDKTQKEIEGLLLNLPADKSSGDDLEDADENDKDLKPLLKVAESLPTAKLTDAKKIKIPEPTPITKKEVLKPAIKPPVVSEELEEPKESLPKVYRTGATPINRKPIADVLTTREKERKAAPLYSSIPQDKAVLTGPLEELKFLSLENFHRLGNSPDEQIAKLLTKINILEKDSITKKAQGIEAWRNSPVYQLYLSLGEESLSHGKNVENIIREKLAAGQTTLTIEDFAAISDLNKLLRF